MKKKTKNQTTKTVDKTISESKLFWRKMIKAINIGNGPSGLDLVIGDSCGFGIYFRKKNSTGNVFI